MRRFIAFASVLVVLSIISVPSAKATCSGTCSKPPNGYVVCQADCVYPATCQVNRQNDPLSYCYYDFVNVCYVGSYDPCCDPDCRIL